MSIIPSRENAFELSPCQEKNKSYKSKENRVADPEN